MNRILARGVDAVRRGDLRTPVDWALRQADPRDRGIAVSDVHARAPTWVDTDDEVAVARVGRYADRAEFATVLTGASPVVLAPPEPFTAVEFGLVDVRGTERVDVAVTFTTVDGRTVERTSTYVDSPHNSENVVPVVVSCDEPAARAEIRVTAHGGDVGGTAGAVGRVRDRLDPDDREKRGGGLWLTAPAVQSVARKPPVFVVSVDSFRYDHLHALDPLLRALGVDAVVPAEPRTQGHWTRPSHATLFAGVHTAEHGQVTKPGDDPRHRRPIPPQLPLLPAVLAEQGYTCSAVVNTVNLSPEYGYARGFHRFAARNRDPWAWQNGGADDAAAIVNQAIRWLDEDARAGREDVFYFLHLFDAHVPYIPPLPVRGEGVDLNRLLRYQEASTTDRYLDLRHDDAGEIIDFPREEVPEILACYEGALRYVAENLVRLVAHIERLGLLDDALVVVTGDHGEEFLERGFTGHNTLYDANIRPGMIVKPPATADWTVPDEVDTVDLLPTVATMLGVPVPEGCVGHPLQSRPAGLPRITERNRSDWYCLAVELEGVKGVFTYPADDFPRRPSEGTLVAGPLEEEFYVLERVRDGDFDDHRAAVPRSLRDRLRETAEAFVRGNPTDAPDADLETVAMSAAVEQQLADLGYR